jgi:hypothetical protein
MAEPEDSKEKYNAYHREWMRAKRAATRQEYNAYMRAWRATNRQRARKLAAEGRARWVAANPEKAKESDAKAHAKWRANNRARYSYALHKGSSRWRKIAFLLTFEEWMAIWRESGRWEQRGGGLDQYCMARYHDVGPYAVGNVRICTNRENFSEAHENRRGKPLSAETRKKISRAAKARYRR